MAFPPQARLCPNSEQQRIFSHVTRSNLSHLQRNGRHTTALFTDRVSILIYKTSLGLNWVLVLDNSISLFDVQCCVQDLTETNQILRTADQNVNRELSSSACWRVRSFVTAELLLNITA